MIPESPNRRFIFNFLIPGVVYCVEENLEVMFTLLTMFYRCWVWRSDH